MKKRAVILGAGPSGLITAWKLLEAGWSVAIYEKNDAVGGMCRTWRWGEFLVDAGPHIYHTPDKKLAEFWDAEFGDLLIKGEFWCKNVKGDQFEQYWDYPLSWESIAAYPAQLKQKIIREIQSLSFEGKASARNYTEYIESQVGPTLRELFFKKYPEKIWGIATEEMTPDWAPKRIELRQKITPFYYNQWNAVGKIGCGCIYERIREKILALGGQIRTNAEVKTIQFSDKYITGIELLTGEPIKINKDEVVISSLPITRTARFLGYESKLQFRGVKFIYLAYERPQILPQGIDWLYYDSERVLFNRITEPKKLSPFMAPKEKSYLVAELTFSPAGPIDKMDPRQLMQKVAEQVEIVGLAGRDELRDCSMHQEDFVYPLQYKGYQEELARTRAEISRFQQFYSVGTSGDFNYADAQILFHKAFDLVSILSGKGAVCTQVHRQAARSDFNQTVIIGKRKIGAAERPYLIAELGLNHNGSLDIAKRLIDAAKAANCDAVKLQTFKASTRLSKEVKTVKYAEQTIGLQETLYDLFERLAMDFQQQKELFAYARDKDIEIFSTPFDFASVDFLESLEVKAYKIASMDLVNLPLIEYIAKTAKPIILSTGMSTLGQVEEAVNLIAQAANPNLVLMHCNSSYPAAAEEMNLGVIESLKKIFKVPVGLSDHTFGLFVAELALVIGANVIERHITLDRAMSGPDHIFSSEPEELARLVSISAKIPKIIGDGIKRIQPNEYEAINAQRKSLYAACDIGVGEVITREKIVIKGPGGGLLPRYLDVVVGRVAQKAFAKDYPITWEGI